MRTELRVGGAEDRSTGAAGSPAVHEGRGRDPNAARSLGTARVDLDDLIERERAWHDLTMLRFVSHPRLLSVFPEYLVGVYHAMRTAGPLMEAARQRSLALAAECPVAAALVPYWTRHIAEETGHDAWMREDIAALGLDVDLVLADAPIPEIAELIGTLHFWVLHTHPVAALAYFYVVERSPPRVHVLDWLTGSRGVPRVGLRTFYRHADIDVEHGRELEELMDSLPLAAPHRELLSLSTVTVFRHLSSIIERHLARADALDT